MTRISPLIALVVGLGCVGSNSDDTTEQPSTLGVEALVRGAVEDWDRVLDINCKCLVDSGTFETLEACVKPSASTPDWVSCGTMALAKFDHERTLVAARCLRDELETRSDCLAQTACGSKEQQQCEMGAMQCASKDPEVLVAVLQACPDLGLLSRPLMP